MNDHCFCAKQKLIETEIQMKNKCEHFCAFNNFLNMYSMNYSNRVDCYGPVQSDSISSTVFIRSDCYVFSQRNASETNEKILGKDNIENSFQSNFFYLFFSMQENSFSKRTHLVDKRGRKQLRYSILANSKDFLMFAEVCRESYHCLRGLARLRVAGLISPPLNRRNQSAIYQ